MKSPIFKILKVICIFALTINTDYKIWGQVQALNLNDLSKQALSKGANGAATYLLYADYIKNPTEFNDYEITAYLLVKVEEYTRADSLLQAMRAKKSIEELCDSLRYYYFTSRAIIDHYNHDNVNALRSIAQVQSSPELSLLKADCYVDLGLFENAIKVYSTLYDDYTEEYLNCQIGECYRKNGDYVKAIEYYKSAMRSHPDWAFPYYGMGWSYELLGDDDTALKYYNYGLDVNKSYAYLFLMRGEMYQKMGQYESAKEDFNTVLQIDKTLKDGTCRQYALFFLGRSEDAINWMNRLIEMQPNNPGHYYDKACLCCRMGLIDEAVKAMESAFRLGYREFSHLDADDDIEPIKSNPKYVALYEKYHIIYIDELEKLKNIL